jgi:hypothetical protein
MDSDQSYGGSDEEPKKIPKDKAKKNSSSSASAAKNKSKDTSLLKQSMFPRPYHNFNSHALIDD